MQRHEVVILGYENVSVPTDVFPYLRVVTVSQPHIRYVNSLARKIL